MSLKRGISLKTTRKKPASLCLSCKKRKFKTDSIIMESYQKPVAWKKRLGLQTKFPGDKVPRTLRNKTPEGARFCVKVNLGKRFADRWILYYAAEPNSNGKGKGNGNGNGKGINSAEQAYGGFKNRGMTRTDSNGEGVLRVRCPQRYREEGRIFPRHVHFLTTKRGNQEWDRKMFTVGIRCV